MPAPWRGRRSHLPTRSRNEPTLTWGLGQSTECTNSNLEAQESFPAAVSLVASFACCRCQLGLTWVSLCAMIVMSRVIARERECLEEAPSLRSNLDHIHVIWETILCATSRASLG